MANKKGVLVVFSGFAGSGKGTIMKELVSRYPDTYALSISATTRSPRPGEVDGREYFFKSVEEFENLIDNNMMLEYANYVDNYYGTPREYVDKMLNEGKDVILEIETQGALKVKELIPETLLIFVSPKDEATLYGRLKGRGTEDDATILKRMKQAYNESKLIPKYDYLVINDELEECVNLVHSIINNEHNRTNRQSDLINTLSKELEKYEKGE